jgi:two-component system response regulator PilR (NtrC family)
MLANPRCLIVDDEADICDLLSITIERMGIKTDSAQSLEDAKFCLSRHRYDLCLTDMRLPDGNGLDLMKYINLHHSGLPIAVMTAFGTSDNAVSSLKAGAFDYLSKPISLQQLRPLVSSAIKPHQLNSRKNSQLSLVGNSSPVKEVHAAIDTISQSNGHVLITGETGTGKELAAKLIHSNSARREQNFVKVNCETVTEKNAAIQFFGAPKNNESSSKKSKVGIFETARNGTLFLDKVEKLPLHAQNLLQEALRENRENIRVIGSTHQDLKKQLDQDCFDASFYYQINTHSLHMPALRNMRDDIPNIARHLLIKIVWPAEQVPMLSACALTKLKSCHFGGNVGELESVLERAYALHQPEIIQADHLTVKENHVFTPSSIDAEAVEMPLPDYLEHVEKHAILKALNKTQQNKTAAAKLLGVSFRTLRYRLSKLGLSKKVQ